MSWLGSFAFLYKDTGMAGQARLASLENECYICLQSQVMEAAGQHLPQSCRSK